MFTIEQIKQAHSKVQSGADFPAYIREIKTFGVQGYETSVADGHTVYQGANGFKASSPPKYDSLPIADVANVAQFKTDLLAHQQGQSDFLTFIKHCAGLGIERWAVDMDQMTCIYFNKAGEAVLTEPIPQ